MHIFVLLVVLISGLTLKPLVLLESIIFHEMFEVNYICVFDEERPLHVKFHFQVDSLIQVEIDESSILIANMKASRVYLDHKKCEFRVEVYVLHAILLLV